MKLKGIDVSHHQGKINWEAVKASGIDFAIVRVGYSNRNGNGGLNLDKRYAYNLQQCNKLGIPVGVYIYCYDKTAYAASVTTKAFVKVIKKFKIEYPVIYDIEYDNANLPKEVNTAICNAAMKEIEEAGYYGMVYASKDFFLNHLNLSGLKQTDKWEAAYSKVDNDLVENGVWQYTSSGSIAGINGPVDLDYSYKDYASIIRKAGLNGFVKERETPIEATVVKPTPVTGLVTEDVKQVSTIKKTVTANKLNVRSGAGMDNPVVTVIAKGDTVSVEEEANGWSKIGTNRWVSTKFLK